MNLPTLMTGAAPILNIRGKIGCLCLHGISASPHEVSWLGEYLAEQGITTYIPRLTGHGAVDHQIFRYARWQDWYLDALDGYHLLRQTCDQVFVAGLSMGGLLSILLAASQPVDGLIVMAAPVQQPDNKLMPYANWIKLVRPFLDMPDTSDFPARLKETQAARGESVLGRVRYDIWATQAVQELHTLIPIAAEHAPAVHAPALLLYSKGDQTVPIACQEDLAQRLNSAFIMQHTYENSGHILTQDVDHEDVFQRVHDFIQRIVQSAI